MRPGRLHLVFTLCCAVVSNQAVLNAQAPREQRTLSLDSRYFVNGYSNKAIGRFGIETIHLGGLPASLIFDPDSAADDDESVFLFYNARQLSYIGEGLTLLIGSTLFSRPFHLPFHEFGHGTRFAAVGLKPSYGHGRPAHDPRQAQTYKSFFAYYLSSFLHFGGGYAFWDETLFPWPLSAEKFGEWDAVVRMGGVNNSMLFTEMIEDELYRGGGHLGFAPSYVFGKLSATLYGYNDSGSNDIARIVSHFQIRGVDIDRKKIQRASITSFFLSSITYQFAHQFIRLLIGESTRFRPWEFFGVQLPNTAFYITRDGLSYKIRSGFRYDSWRFPVAVEYVFEGSKRMEVTIGAETAFEKFNAAVETIIGKQLEVELELSYRYSRWLLLAGGYALYNVNNLHGERQIPSLQHGPAYHEIYLRGSLVY